MLTYATALRSRPARSSAYSVEPYRPYSSPSQVASTRAEELPPPPWPTGDPDAIRHEELDTVLQAARNGEEDAFRTLYRHIHPRLLRYVRTLAGDDAEDVASEAWLQIARDIASFDGDIDGFRGWTSTIARHRALDHLRRHNRRPVQHAPAGELPEHPASDDTETTALDSLSTQAALALIARLPRDQAEIIVLRVVMGLDAKTVARVLGKRPGAVRTAAHRGLRRLEHLLNDPEPPR
jgi:RNA polymerase sigma-70 factor (ECF subfamily)